MITRSMLLKQAAELTEALENIDRTLIHIEVDGGKLILHDGEEYGRKEIVVWEN